MKAYFVALLLFFVSTTTRVFGQSSVIPDAPNPPRLVNDFAGVLSSQEVGSLERKLDNFNRETSNQIVVAIVSDLGGLEPAEYSFKLGNKWGVGRDKLRNGIIILIKPKTAGGKGRAFIATGRGLEGAIPDATCFDVVQKEMIPRFKENNYYQGLDDATTVLMKLAKGEFNYADYSKKANNDNFFVTAVVIFVILAFLVFLSNRKKNYRRNGNNTYYEPWWFFNFGGGSDWGSDSGSSSSDSGFDGFGGGDFGGGGAGGDW